MERKKLRTIPYGVMNWALMVRECHFVDNTAYIRKLELCRTPVFLRPRHFGKSLLCSILQAYYDVDYAAQFEALFGGLDIGRNPTDEHGKYLFLDFNFTGVEKQFERVQSSFNDYCAERLDVFAEFMHDFVPKAYQDVYGVDPQLFDIGNGMTDFAETGDWHGALDTVCAVVSRYWKERDAIEGERVVQTALCSLLYVGHGPYIVRHEQESGGGFVDIAFEPQLNRWPEIGHAALVELKYLKKEDDASPARGTSSPPAPCSSTASSLSSTAATWRWQRTCPHDWHVTDRRKTSKPPNAQTCYTIRREIHQHFHF